MPPTESRRTFWNWHCWKSIGFFPCTQVMCQWSLELIFQAKLKSESGNRKIQYGCQADILKEKIVRILPIATKNMHMKFEIEIPKQTWVALWISCRQQTDGRTEKMWIQFTPTNFVGREYNNRFAGNLICYDYLVTSVCFIHWVMFKALDKKKIGLPHYQWNCSIY